MKHVLTLAPLALITASSLASADDAGAAFQRAQTAWKAGRIHEACQAFEQSEKLAHCALAGIPGAIAYRTNPLTFLMARWWVKIEYIGIANLLLKEPMYPEFIQNAATPSALAAELHACLEEPVRQARTAAQAGHLRALLSQPASGTAADWLARHL